MKYANRWVFRLLAILPQLLVHIVLLVLIGVLVVDILASYLLVTGKSRHPEKWLEANNKIDRFRIRLGNKISDSIEKPTTKASPKASFVEKVTKDKTVFAKGCDFYKIVMLFLGANVECSAQNFYEFAVMGSIFAENRLNLVYPRIALLNIGVEEIKGNQSIREAANLLEKSTALNYTGFIEGNLLLNGVADVIVSDGFSGNIALKTLEGAAKNLLSLLKGKEKQPIFKSFAKFILRFFFKDAYHRLKRINPDEYNGASLLGLTAVVVKSHGSANVDAFARAIADAALQARLQIPQKILAGLQRY